MSLFITLLAPFLLLIFLNNPEYFVLGKYSESGEQDLTPKEGFATLLVSLWSWYRLLLFDNSSLQDDYEQPFSKQILIDLILYSLMETASKPFLRLPAFLVGYFVSPYAFGSLVYYKLYGEQTQEVLQQIWVKI